MTGADSIAYPIGLSGFPPVWSSRHHVQRPRHIHVSQSKAYVNTLSQYINSVLNNLNEAGAITSTACLLQSQ